MRETRNGDAAAQNDAWLIPAYAGAQKLEVFPAVIRGLIPAHAGGTFHRELQGDLVRIIPAYAGAPRTARLGR